MSLLALSNNKTSSNNVLFLKSFPAIHLSFNALNVSHNSNLVWLPSVSLLKLELFTLLTFGKFNLNIDIKLFNILFCKTFVDVK